MRFNFFYVVVIGLFPLQANARLFGQRPEATPAHQGPLVLISDRLRAATADAARGLEAVIAASNRPKTTSESLLPAAGRRALVSAGERAPPIEETLQLHWVVAPYLQDVNLALAQLGHAERFGDVAAPAQRLITALLPIVRELEEVVALGPRAERLWIGTSEAASNLALHVAGLHKHLDELEKIEHRMQRPAAAPGRALRVTWVEQKSGGAVAHLRWRPQQSVPPSFQTEVFRAAGDGTSRRDATLAATLPKETDAFDDVWDGALPESLRYYLVGKTVFGVVSEDAGEIAIGVPEYLAPPTNVTAATVRPTPQLRDFYHAAGAVTISWHRSRSDLSGITRAEELAFEEDAPRVERYEIYRMSDTSYEVVGQVSAGTEHFIDVPSPEELKGGLRYAVASVDFSERTAGGPHTPSQSGVVQADLSYTLALARMGMEHLRADALTAGGALRLLTPAVRAQAERAWAAQTPEQRATLKQQFWSQLTDEDRRNAYSVWHPNGDIADFSQGTLELIDLAYRARIDPTVQSRADAAWKDLEPSGQRAALARWQESRGLNISRACSPWMHTQQPPTGKDLCQSDLRRFAWITQLDPEDKRPLFENVTPSLRAAEVALLDPGLRDALTHTDWPHLQPASIARWHATAWGKLNKETIPQAISDDLAAWNYWQGLDAKARLALIRQAVGPVETLMAQSRYLTRPLDVWLDFKLSTIAVVLFVGTACALFLRRMRLDGL